MTLDSTTSKVQYTQSGTTTAWPVPYKFLDNEDLIVITTVGGVDTTLVLDTDYTVTGAGDDDGGTVTISPAVATGTRVTIYREINLDQPTELTTAGGWFPKVHEAAFDRLTMQIQQVQEAVDRSVKIQVTSTDTPDNIISALYTVRDDASASAVSAAGSADTATTSADTATTQAGLAADEATAAAQSAQDAQAAADSIGVMQSRGVLLAGQDTITLTWTYNPTLKNVAVFLDGVKQDADTALIYTDANTITLTEAVTEATNWEVISVTLVGDSTLSGYVDQCQDIVNNAALSNLPIGAIVTLTGSTPAAGTVAAQGQLLSRAAYPDLWAFAQASGNISVDDASWTKGQYSPGDGSTTFRVPNLQDQFIRGASGTRAVGNGEEDAFQGHNFGILAGDLGAFGLNVSGGSTQVTAMRPESTPKAYPTTDGTNGTPRTANETRPKNVAYLICIKAYDVISDQNVLNAVEVVNDINRLESEKLAKTDIIAPGDAPMFACRAWVNFDGTTTPPIIRASGNVSSVVRNDVGDYMINFTAPMPDINYCVTGGGMLDEVSVNMRIASVGIKRGALSHMDISYCRIQITEDTNIPWDPKVATVIFFR